MEWILPTILSLLTRKPREKVEIKWSESSWTHNVFRLYEMIFWRKSGIRAEAASYCFEDEDGEMLVKHEFFTFEAFCAHSETLLRRFLSRKSLGIREFKIHFRRMFGLDPIPVFDMGMGMNTAFRPMPFISLAIALDAETDASSSSTGTTLTFAHTCTGSNLILFVGASGNNTGNAVDDITGSTYNAVGMTQIDKVSVAADRFRYLFNLTGPATGANNVVVSSSTTNGFKAGASISYTGASQSGQPDAHNTNNGTANTLVTSVTVVASNCWIVLAAGVGGASPTAGAGATMRGTGQVITWFDSNGTVAAGSQSMTINTSDTPTTHPIMALMASFAPPGAAVASTKRLLMSMGIGQ